MILVLKWTTAPRQVSWLHWEMMERPTAVRAAPEWEMLKHPVQGAAALLLGQGHEHLQQGKARPQSRRGAAWVALQTISSSGSS